MDGARKYYAKQNNSIERDKYHMISLLCGISDTKQMSKGKKEKERERHIKK